MSLPCTHTRPSIFVDLCTFFRGDGPSSSHCTCQLKCSNCNSRSDSDPCRECSQRTKCIKCLRYLPEHSFVCSGDTTCIACTRRRSKSRKVKSALEGNTVEITVQIPANCHSFDDLLCRSDSSIQHAIRQQLNLHR